MNPVTFTHEHDAAYHERKARLARQEQAKSERRSQGYRKAAVASHFTSGLGTSLIFKGMSKRAARKAEDARQRADAHQAVAHHQQYHCGAPVPCPPAHHQVPAHYHVATVEVAQEACVPAPTPPVYHAGPHGTPTPPPPAYHR